MTKPIKVDDDVYDEIESLRLKSETKGNVIRRLLKVFTTVKSIENLLEPHGWREEVNK